MTAAYLVNGTSGRGYTHGQMHLALQRGGDALCGAVPPNAAGHDMQGNYWAGWPTVGDRAEFERLLPERICKRCRRVERSTAA